jgi:ferric iron reductase protein FhuF
VNDTNPTRPDQCRQALRAVADIGDFFCLDRPNLIGTPLSHMVTSLEVYASRIGATRHAVARLTDSDGDALPRRPIASLLFLGIAARLVAPTLATAAIYRLVPQLDLEDVTTAGLADGRLVLKLTRFHALNHRPVTHIPDLADLIGEHLIDGQISRLVCSFASRDALHPRLLWGNVASTVASAAKLIDQYHPDYTDTTDRTARLILERPPLAGCGYLSQDSDGTHYHRRSCCLYYQLPNAGTCSDCPLPPWPSAAARIDQTE